MIRRNVEVTNPNEAAHRRELARGINLLNQSIRLRGQIDTGGPSEVIEDEAIGDDAIAIFVPADANAAASTFYVTVAAKQVTFNLASGSGGKFDYLIVL